MEGYPDSPPYERYDEVAAVMSAWMHSHKDKSPAHLDLGNSELLSHDQLATEIDQGTDRGRSYVLTFMDGAANSERISLDEALQLFRRRTKLNNSGPIMAFVRRLIDRDPVEKRIRKSRRTN